MTGGSSGTSADRRRAMLRTALGPTIAAALSDPAVIEIMVNPDGALRLDRLGEGRVDTHTHYDPAQVERIIRLVAAYAHSEVHAASPIVSAELPPHGEGAGERFEGVLPPVSLAPCFSIRKPAARIHRLIDYVNDGIMPAETARLLSLAVVERKNILVAGGTSSGKTTLANALLAEMAHLDERVILIEDTRELQCAAPDVVALRTRAGSVSVADLVRSTLRLRPDRIIVGEVRGREALDMLKAWNTGHSGGIATVHANSAGAALYRLEQLVQEAVTTVLRTNIVITTDRRAYHLQMESTASTAMTAISWTYPGDALLALRRAEAATKAAAPIATGLAVEKLSFSYTISGDDPPWRPLRAFDDGQQTFIEFPANIAVGEAPPLFVIDAGGDAILVNYRMVGHYYVIDRLFDAAELRLGGKRQQIVRISRVGSERRSQRRGRPS